MAIKVFQHENNRVEFLDERFYQDTDGVYYPSVTTYLQAYWKGKRYEQWLMDTGNNSKEILERYGIRGTNVHNACESLLRGQKVEWINYSYDEWKMILRFYNFYNSAKMEIIAIEHQIISKTLKAGGTIDIVCKINGEIWLIDYKTSNYIFDTHFLQVAAYSAMWNEQNPELRINRMGILHLDSLTRTEKFDDYKMQGKQWKIEEPDESPSDMLEIFKHVQALYKRINPNEKPLNMVMPAILQLEIKEPKEKKVREKVLLPFED